MNQQAGIQKGGVTMLEKNIKKEERKKRPLWTPYYNRVVKNKKVYRRNKKQNKHILNEE